MSAVNILQGGPNDAGPGQTSIMSQIPMENDEPSVAADIFRWHGMWPLVISGQSLTGL